MNRPSMKKRIAKWFLLSVGVAPLVYAGAVPSAPAKLTLEDLIDATGLSSVSLSPDGSKFAIVRDGQIDLVSSNGGWPVHLTTSTGGKQGGKWSPDGSTIAFVGGGSIWEVPSAGGEPVRLTDNRPGPGDPRTSTDRAPQWSPDGKWILYETGRSGFAGLAVVSKDGLSSNYLTSAPADDEGAAWSPDGKSVAYVERSPKYFSGRLLVANFDSSTGKFSNEPKIIYTAETDRGGGWSIRPPVWSPDGKSLAIVLQDTGWNKIYLLPATGGEPRAITNGESEDGDPVFAPDGKRLAFLSNRNKPEEQHIWVASADGAQPHELASPSAGIDAEPIWSPDSRQIYFLHSSSFEPSSLAVTAVDSGATRTLIRTQPVNFANTGLPQPEVVHFKSKDGRDISGILYRPLDYAQGKQYPAVLWIHGGPEGQDTLAFDPWNLYLAQNGYVVLTPNYRGSTGYGEKFRNLNVEDSGGGEVEDVAAGAQYLVSQGLADKDRIGIGGGSHGGTMVAYEVTKQPELWHAAIELYGVVDRAAFIERTNRPSAIRWTDKMGGPPEQKPEVYKKANILPDVPKITAPLLIMHGEDDPQVPPYESQLFTAALKKAGKPYLYFTYPKELHGFSQRDHRLDAWRKQVAFLNYYLKPESGRSITSTQDIVLDDADIK
jgi:dipeptidyl aminopeptidase/acylaminoacyl peptidase